MSFKANYNTPLQTMNSKTIAEAFRCHVLQFLQFMRPVACLFSVALLPHALFLLINLFEDAPNAALFSTFVIPVCFAVFGHTKVLNFARAAAMVYLNIASVWVTVLVLATTLLWTVTHQIWWIAPGTYEKKLFLTPLYTSYINAYSHSTKKFD